MAKVIIVQFNKGDVRLEFDLQGGKSLKESARCGSFRTDSVDDTAYLLEPDVRHGKAQTYKFNVKTNSVL